SGKGGMQTAAQGAENPVFVATEVGEATLEKTGTFWHNKRVIKDVYGDDVDGCNKLWEILQKDDDEILKKLAAKRH
ncbi:hypothetical protein ABTL13_19800, partial [Acinetobacter baumannii]